MSRTTPADQIEVTGPGLHSGRPCACRIGPAPSGAGWRLWGTPIGLDAVIDAGLATTLKSARGPISTVEHLFAALAGRGIADVHIEVDGGEVPILDGSARPWLQALDAAGIETRGDPAPAPLVLDRPVIVRDGDRWLRADPAPAAHFVVTIDFPLLGRQTFEAPVARMERVADARTFGFAHHAAALHAAGRALGARLDNTVVFDAHGAPLAPLRHPDEPARHKWLDLLGDLALLGRPLQARVEGFKPGHALHHRLVAALGGPSHAPES